MPRFNAPRQTPPLSYMLDNIGASAKDTARALDVSERTVFNWMKAEGAPRAAMLALFFQTTWGHEWVHTAAHNAATVQGRLASAYAQEIERLRARVAYLERVGVFGSANDPCVTPERAPRGLHLVAGF